MLPFPARAPAGHPGPVTASARIRAQYTRACEIWSCKSAVEEDVYGDADADSDAQSGSAPARDRDRAPLIGNTAVKVLKERDGDGLVECD